MFWSQGKSLYALVRRCISLTMFGEKAERREPRIAMQDERQTVDLPPNGPARDRPGIERDPLGQQTSEAAAEFLACQESLSGVPGR